MGLAVDQRDRVSYFRRKRRTVLTFGEENDEWFFWEEECGGAGFLSE